MNMQTTADPQFCTGYGQSDTHAEVMSCGKPNPHRAAGTPYPTITGRQIVKMIKDPPSVPKDQAQWLIPSTYAASDARSHEPQRQNGEFRFLALDSDKNNLDVETIVRALDAVCGKCRWMIYSSRGSTDQLKKWRALVPLKTPLAGADYEDTAKAFFDLLEEATEGELICDRVLERPGQLIYLPNRGQFYDWRIVDGAQLDLVDQHPILKRRWKIRAKRAQIEAEAKRRRDARKIKAMADPSGTASIIEAFNTANPVADLLDKYGYSMGRNGRDYQSPNSSTGSYAVRNFGEFWFSFSGSDDAADIGQRHAGGRIGDAFDLFTHFDHGGDQGSAVRAYAEEIGEDHRSRRARAEAEMLRGLGNISAKADQQPGEGQGKPKRRFKLIRADKLEFREPDWLVKGLIEADTLSLIFGDPGCGKSFVAFDLAASIATGRAFHGHETKRGAVIYVCGEGHNGIKRRLMAWEKHTGQRLDNQPLYISQVSAQFLDPASVAELTEAIDEAAQEAEIPVAMIIIDTLNRNMGAGDESNTKDMTMFIAAVDAAKARYKAGALIVHHTGHGNKERARGSYSLHGALDHEYRMEKIDQAFTLTNTKMKEGAPPAPLGFKLVEVVVGRTRFGEDVTSAALEVTEAPKRECRLKASWKLALDTLKEAKKRAGHGDDPSQFIDLEAWRAVYYEKSPADNPRPAFHRARQELVAAEILLCHENNYRISKLVPPFTDA